MTFSRYHRTRVCSFCCCSAKETILKQQVTFYIKKLTSLRFFACVFDSIGEYCKWIMCDTGIKRKGTGWKNCEFRFAIGCGRQSVSHFANTNGRNVQQMDSCQMRRQIAGQEKNIRQTLTLDCREEISTS
ncbi:ribosomal protein L37a [Trichinella spiralis]|uniref:ribosomal protein L37a n=1 Tax=Trichinella spiralis TaxID=6334 RepID=UPI0001EFCEFC|nr:ribosomal protein L37a [Trichinella spiralis]